MEELLQRPIAFHPALARRLGGINEAIFWQQIYFWGDKGKRTDGFIYKTKKEIEDETTLTSRQQDRIVSKLKEMGFLEVRLMRANGAPTLHYRAINPFPITTKGDNPLLQKVIMEYDKTSESVTETTTEITTDTKYSEPGSRDIPVLIDAFKDVNPSYKKWFINRTQRAACSRMLERHGLEKLLKIISWLPKTNTMDYVPTITSPVQLEDKMASLAAALQKVKNREPIVV